MREPPQKGTVPEGAGVSPTWKGMECAVTTDPPTIRFGKIGRLHWQVSLTVFICSRKKN